MFTKPLLSLITVCFLVLADGQTLSNITVSSPLVPVGSDVSIQVALIGPFTPTWSFLWSINQSFVATVLPGIGPAANTLNITIANSTYKDRVYVSASTTRVTEFSNFSTTLVLRDVVVGDDGTIATALLFTPFAIGQQHFNLSTSFRTGCTRTFTSDLGVQATSIEPNTVGNLTCAGSGGYPFYRDGSALASLSTVCLPDRTWLGYSDIECLYEPKPELAFLATPFTLALVCNNVTNTHSTLFYFGKKAFQVNGSFYEINESNRDKNLIGSTMSCQPVTPYTRMFNASGRSKPITLFAFERPSQIVDSCSWYLGLSQSCDVIFTGQPQLEFVSLNKSRKLLSNNNSLEMQTNNKSIHIYRFHRGKVSPDDLANYSLTVRYTNYPGLHYIIKFAITERPLPPANQSCIWFIDEYSACDVTLPSDATILELRHNGTLVDSSSYTLSSGRLSFFSPQATLNAEGNYTISYRSPMNEDAIIQIRVFVRRYPINAGLVIGVTIAALILIIGVLVLSCCCLSRKRGSENGNVELKKLNKDARPAEVAAAGENH